MKDVVQQASKQSAENSTINKDDLKRNISGLNAYTMVVGTVIGTGIFFVPQQVFGVSGTTTLGLLIWLIGCFLGLAGALTVAELSALIPETGGMVTYLEKTFSPFVGFLLGWAQTIGFYPIRFAAAALVFGTQSASLLGLDDNWIIPIAIGITLLINIINALGNKATGFLQGLSTVLKFLPIIAIIIFGFFFNDNPIELRLFPMAIASHPIGNALSVGVIATLYATDGWMNVTNIAGEIKNPQKNIPRALVYGIGTVLVTYLMINVAYLRVMSPEQLSMSGTPASDVATILFGNLGGRLISSGILVSVFGSQLGFVRAGWRVPYAMGLRDQLPFSKWFSKVNDKTDMPINSGLFLMIVTVLGLLLIGEFSVLANIGSFIIWFFYTLTFIAVIILRKRWPDRPRPYKVPLYPIIPIVGILGGVLILASTLLYQPVIAIWGTLLTFSGIPVYYYRQSRKTETLSEKILEKSEV